MKTAAALCMAGLIAAAASAAETDGVKPGEFTMDYDAAKAYAAEHKLPILLDFSGSDWCHWCQVMDSNVFEKPEWKAYAAESVVTVLLDFPQDKSLVPEKYAARNDALAAQYGVEGFPTFVVLDDDGATELGRLQAGQEKTPASFQAELESLFRNRPAALAAFAASLSPENKAAFEKINTALEQKKSDLEQAQAAVAAASEKAQSTAKELMNLESELKEFRIGQEQGEKKLKEYKAVKVQLDARMQELEAWLATNPAQNEENMQKFNGMRTALQELSAKLEAF